MNTRRERMIRRAAVLASGAFAVATGAPAAAPASSPEAATTLACGRSLSAPIFGEWRGLGGEAGRLGCPLEAERPSAASPQGSRGQEANFAGGTVVWHTTGPRAGQVYAVVACYRTYFQFGGTGGWLGLPISDAENTPDGQRQTFEGGALTYYRSPDGCEETRSAALAAPADLAAAAPLDLFRTAAGDDFESIASLNATARAVAAQYTRVRTEALVFADPAPGLVPLKMFESPAGAHVTVATVQGERAQGDGATFMGVQGYVRTQPSVGAVALKQYHNAATGHDMLVATPDGEADAKAAGYVFARIEGYAAAVPPPLPHPTPITPQTSAPGQTAP